MKGIPEKRCGTCRHSVDVISSNKMLCQKSELLVYWAEICEDYQDTTI